jgi:hypothetical protein
MHKEILTQEQIELLPLIKIFAKQFYLVGGTAVALYVGHRRSIDFDLFTLKPLRPKRLKDEIERRHFQIEKIFIQSEEQFTMIVNTVKLTFFQYPFDIPHPIQFEKIIMLPELLDLAAMKAYALGKRAKWKDYVDLYMLLKMYLSLDDLINRAKTLFEDLFSERLFRQQLSYFKDIDDREKIEWIYPSISDDEIKSFLTEVVITPF